MKVLSFLLLISFLYSSCNHSSATIKLENKKEVRKALSHQWESVYMETVDSRSKVPEGQITNTVFNENGTYSSRVKNGITVTNGEWNYDPGTKMLYMGEGKEKGPGRVLKLTGNELILAEYLIMNDKIVDSVVVTYKKI